MDTSTVNDRNESGFALLEMVVALGVLVVLTVGGVLTYNGVQQSSKDSAALSAARSVYSVAESYRADNDSLTTPETAAKYYNDTQSDRLPNGRAMLFTEVEELSDGGMKVTAIYGDDESIQVVKTQGAGTISGNPNEGGPGNEDGNNPDPEEETPPVIGVDKVANFTYQCEVETTGRLPVINIADGTKVSVHSGESSFFVDYAPATGVVTEETDDIDALWSLTGNDIIESLKTDNEENHNATEHSSSESINDMTIDIASAVNLPDPITMEAGVEYHVVVEGEFGALDTYRTGSEWQTLNDCLVSIDGFSDGITHIHHIGGSNLVDVPAELPASVVSLNGALSGALSLNDPDVSQWDTTNVVDMTNLFAYNASFTQNLENWDTSNVKSMHGAFQHAYAFNGAGTSGWNTANVVDMRNMFRYAESFDTNINAWNVEKVKNFRGMFYHATSYDKPLNEWKTLSAEDMSWMFAYIGESFNQDLGAWQTGTVTDMNSMFMGATSFNSDIGSWDVSNVTLMYCMFEMTPFNHDLDQWNMSKVTNISHMFDRNDQFNSNVSTWDTSSVKKMIGTFRYAVFDQDISGWKTHNVTSMKEMFTHAYDFSDDLSLWDTSKVTDMSDMFNNAYSFNGNVDEWNTGNVTNMNGMFDHAYSFNRDVSGWDTSQVTDMSYMFALTKLFSRDLTGWDVSNVVNHENFHDAAFLLTDDQIPNFN